ncbi:hypothetical protein PtB15_18B462 [Puccinia triticina]|nr:hypothetical protein PtB15_18B462 [Puccinia triticina]
MDLAHPRFRRVLAFPPSVFVRAGLPTHHNHRLHQRESPFAYDHHLCCQDIH